MDVIPLDATLIKGSHGSVNTPAEFHPVLISDSNINQENINATQVYDVIWKALNL
ncbi:hypothetical protein D3C72_2379540 [compost metagenome]